METTESIALPGNGIHATTPEEENWNEIVPIRKKRHQKRQQQYKYASDNVHNYNKQGNNNACDHHDKTLKSTSAQRAIGNGAASVVVAGKPVAVATRIVKDNSLPFIATVSSSTDESAATDGKDHLWPNNTIKVEVLEQNNVNPTTTLVRVKEYEADFPSLGETAKMTDREIKEIVQKQETQRKVKPHVNKSHGKFNGNKNQSEHSNTGESKNTASGGGNKMLNNRPIAHKSASNYNVNGRRHMSNRDNTYDAQHAAKPVSKDIKQVGNGGVSLLQDPICHPNTDTTSNVCPLKYYETETMMYHATSVLTEGLFDMIYQEIEEEINNDRAQQYRYLSDSASSNYEIYLSWFRTIFDVYRIVNDVQDFSVFARHAFALPDYYISHLLQLTPDIVRDVVMFSKGEFTHDQKTQLVRRTMPLTLEERVLLHYNQLANDFDILRNDRMLLIRELLEYYLSPDGLPASEYIGRALVDSVARGDTTPRIQIDQLTWHKKLGRLRVTPQEVLKALSGSRIVRLIDNVWVELVEPLSEQVIESIRGASPVHSISSTMSHQSAIFNGVNDLYYGAWRPPVGEEIIPVIPIPTHYFALTNEYGCDSQTFIPIDVNQCVSYPEIVAPQPTTGGLKSGTRTRNPSTLSALGDENTRPDDIFICINSDDEALDACLSGNEGSTYSTGGTKRANISDRILAKHPAGDRHSAFTKARTRNTKRGAKRETKEVIDAALQYRQGDPASKFDWAEDDGEDAEDKVPAPPSMVVDRSAFKVNVVDSETFKEYQRSANRHRSVSASPVSHAVGSQVMPPPALQDFVPLNMTTTLMMAPEDELCDSMPAPPPPPPLMPVYVDPNSHLGYQQRINPLLPVYGTCEYAHYIVSMDQFVTANHCLARPDLLPVQPAPTSVYYQMPAEAVAYEMSQPMILTTTPHHSTAVAVSAGFIPTTVQAISVPQGTQAAAAPPSTGGVVASGREFTSALRQVKAADDVKSAEPRVKMPRSRKSSQTGETEKQSIHPLRMDRSDASAMTKLPEKASGVFVYKPRPRTLSGSLLDNASNSRMSPHGRKLYYDELLLKGTKERAEKGIGKSQWMNLYYNVSRGILNQRFNRGIYETFKTYAIEDDQNGARYGLQCLFYFYSFFLETRFRNDLYMDFEHLVSEDVLNGKWYGFEKFWAFFYFSGKKPHALVKDSHLIQQLKAYNSKEKIRSQMEVPHAFRIPSK